jgi:hypothetical protein
MSTGRKWPFEYADEDGCLLRVLPSADMPGWFLVRTEGGCVRVPPSGLPSVVAALYEACGLAAPLILERPVTDLRAGKGVNVFSILPGRDRTVLVSQGSGHDHVPLAPGVARLLASVIAAYADAAEADEPDPTEVEDLAGKISAAMALRGGGTGGVYRVAAEVAIRHFRDQQRGEKR